MVDDFSEGAPVAFGVRDPADDEPFRDDVALTLRASLLFAGWSIALFGGAVGVRNRLHFGAWDVASVLFATIGLCVAAEMLRYSTGPLLRAHGTRLTWRRPLGLGTTEIHASDIAWPRDARFVGRFLIVRTAKGDARRIPIWTASRASQRRLFAWLDERATAPPPSPPLAPVDRATARRATR